MDARAGRNRGFLSIFLGFASPGAVLDALALLHPPMMVFSFG